MRMRKHKVFIVHGHDNKAKAEAESLVYRLEMQPIVLHRQASRGRTIIEKFEQESDVSFAIVLLTPDDKGGPKDKTIWLPRARQNVIFELGYLFAKLGREKVICLVKGNVEKPSDVDGIVYLPFKESVDEVEMDLRKEFGVVSKKPREAPIDKEKSRIVPDGEAESLARECLAWHKQFEKLHREDGHIEPIDVYLDWASTYRRGYVVLAEDYDLFIAVAKKLSEMGFKISLPQLNRKVFERTIKRAKLKEESHRAEAQK